MAKTILSFYPSIHKIRMCNSGTEATMSCIRLARGFTGRDIIIKFDGCYHGHVDSLLVKAGSGALTFGQPDSAGIPPALAKLTIALPFNDIDAVTHTVHAHKHDIAAIILEPIPANAGLYLPKPGYLEFLRRITTDHDIVLIFDEVMSGFRVASGGAQQLYGIRPDLTALGKIIGGGLPVGAFGGVSEIMDCLAPTGPVYQAGTLSGNPLALAAGMANIEQLTKFPENGPNPYRQLEEKGAFLEGEFIRLGKTSPFPIQVRRMGSMFCVYFTSKAVDNLADAKTSDTKRFARFFYEMLKRGVYVAPSQFEAGFLSLAHSSADMEKTVQAATESFRSIE
jgi:glutamate-1-semialdehyde 2,1-aminomutase